MIVAERKSKDVSAGALSSFLRRARKAAGLAGEINVLITANQHMRRLNRQFRHKDKPTDVLSFPAYQADISQEKYAGDLAISIEIARQNARKLGHSLQDEIKILMLHGILHLAGYDHESDNGKMAKLEEELRLKLGLPATLISRSQIKVPRINRNGRSLPGKVKQRRSSR